MQQQRSEPERYNSVGFRPWNISSSAIQYALLCSKYNILIIVKDGQLS